MNPSTKTALVVCVTAAAAFAPVPAYSPLAGRQERAGADTVVVASKPGKGSRFARLTRAAAAHVDQAVTSAEGATGVSRETMAKVALTASGGGAKAVEQFTRLQRELMTGATGLQSRPAAAQQVGMTAMLREAMACAKTGRGCRSQG